MGDDYFTVGELAHGKVRVKIEPQYRSSPHVFRLSLLSRTCLNSLALRGIVDDIGPKLIRLHRMFHRFSCGAAGSIFEAAHFLEVKPLSGHGSLMDAVPHLAQMKVQRR